MSETKQESMSWFLVTGEVLYSIEGHTDIARSLTNTLHTGEADKGFNIKDIGAMQTKLGTHIQREADANKIKIKIEKITITNIIYLGDMTEDEFRAKDK